MTNPLPPASPAPEPPRSPGAAPLLAPPPIWSPCDVPSRLPPGSVRLRVGGRVRSVRGTVLVLGDALAELEADAEQRWSVSVGALAVVEGELAGARLRGARLVDAGTRAADAASSPVEAHPSASEAWPRLGEALVRRAAVAGSVRRFFAERGFLEVETPVMVRCPGLDVHLDGFEVAGGVVGAPAFLETSPEYHMKRLLCAGLPRIFQLARCFRRGELGTWHNPEFTMLEWYRAFGTMAELMQDTEELVRTLLEEHRGSLSLRVPGTGQVVELAPAFERLTVAEAFARWAPGEGVDPAALARDDEERFFRIWVERVDPGLAAMPVPTFVSEFPAPLASLARLVPDRPEVCERFELYLGGVELCNGFGELTEPREQRRRFEHDQARRAASGLPVYPIDERFLAALEQGMPPSAGNALGLDRLIALCAGADDLASVLAFPAERL